MNIHYYDLNKDEYSCEIDDIVYFKLTNTGLLAFHINGNAYNTDTYISALECSLPTHFVRANEKVIINRNYVKEALAYANEDIVIIMNDDVNSSFIVSKHYLDTVKLNVAVK